MAGLATEPLGVGLEHQYRENTFGPEDSDASLPQAMIRGTS
ncbi:hypothetical protein [Halomonas sp. B23F22_10]